MSFKLTSGSYNVQASESSKSEKPVYNNFKSVKCLVKFLDDTEEIFEIEKKAKAQVLLDKVFEHLELVEKGYFGLQFVDLIPNPDGVRWVDPFRTLRKQVKTGPPYLLLFRVKFYVSDPKKLHEEYTRYHIFLQVKRDILDGRLVCPRPVSISLASYVVQSELGDYNPDDHRDGYLADYRFVPHQDDDFIHEVAKLHKLHRSQTPADSEYNYIQQACEMDMYGVDLYPASVKDRESVVVQLGVSSSGLVLFQESQKVDEFIWDRVIKISFKRKHFYVEIKEEDSQFPNLLGFCMTSYRSSKNLWKSCVEYHTFFRLAAPKPPISRFFMGLGTRFRFSGRTEYQTVEEANRRSRVERSFERTPSKRLARRTIASASHDMIANERKHPNGISDHPQGGMFSNKLRSLTHKPFRSKPLLDSGRSDTDDGGFLSRVASVEPLTNAKAEPVYRPAPRITEIAEEHELPIRNTDSFHNNNEVGLTEGLVRVVMAADAEGRFGFNVKGGADQGMPVIVSRVATGSPADIVVPRLNEGDQVLFINGRDITQHTHEQVVMYIRSTRESHGGHLVLVVRPSGMYIGDPTPEEHDLKYVPERRLSSASGSNLLRESMLMLQDGIDTGAAVADFEQLYRRKPGMQYHAAKMQENLPKNRYLDILPYDETRVLLQKNPNTGKGDYVNANFVNMQIPGSGIMNRYIASQGPLVDTTQDFWRMIWEQQATLIIMLTTQKERGRVKCHKYWPDLYDTNEFGNLHVTSLRDDESPSYVFREFSLVDISSNEDRHITQMQYISWPDHGVPEDSTDFLDFVIQVRKNRVGMVEPTVIHCSAGIGRTGMLICVETAMCLIEADQPVYPLDLIRQMRDQRAMLVQTSSQFRFVCEAILRVYNEFCSDNSVSEDILQKS